MSKPEKTLDEAMKDLATEVSRPFMPILYAMERFLDQRPKLVRLIDVTHKPIMLLFWGAAAAYAIIVIISVM
jgi:hypothetical protein